MILDPKRNLPGIILLVTGIVLAATALVMPSVLSVERGAIDVDTELPPVPHPPDPVDISTPNRDYASAILGKPIFYSDRQLPQEDTVEIEPETEDVAVTVAELNATVTGVIITPESRLAMIKVPGNSGSLILREGMSLDGDLAAWKVGEIQQREVSFAASNGQTAKVELETHDKALTAPAAPRPRANRSVANANENQANNNTAQEQKDRQASLAEEVRRRIAERRAQLRAQRQRQLEQQNEDENE